jgi:sugar porter (SP) family MFS transporter
VPTSLERAFIPTASALGVDHRIGGRLYAFLIAFVSAVGGFLFGYDLAIMGGANVYLREQFGLSSAGFGFTTASAGLGCIMGPFFGGWFCDRIGRRNTLIAACFLLGIGSLFTAIPNDVVTFNIFRIVGGVGVGLCSIASPMYTNELAPARWRGGLGFMYQLAIVVGSVMAAAIAWMLAKWSSPEMSWRWMFGSELLFVAVFAMLLFLIPESPRWLAERGKLAAAQAIFTRIDGPEFAKTEMAEIEKSLAAEPGVLSELFAPGLRKALVVGLCLALFNNYTGWSAMANYLAHLFELGGFSRTDAIFQYLLAYGFMGLMTLIACGLVDRTGRRPLWLISSLVMIGANVLLGLVFHFNLTGIVVLTAVFLCVIPHSFALGPLPWLMMSEIFPTRIRARAVAITTTFIWLVGFLASYLFPILAELSQRLLGSIAGVFWLSGAVCVLAFVFGVTWLPETKGRTLEEIANSWQPRRPEPSPVEKLLHNAPHLQAGEAPGMRAAAVETASIEL